ncbi:hypothetical protein D3C84_807600 [compost metagenome]
MRRAAHGIKRMVVIVGNHARRNGLAVGNQWHVPAHGGFTGEAVLIQRGGKACTQCTDLFGIDPVVFADLASGKVRSGSARLQVQLGGFIVVLDGVEAVLNSVGGVAQL